MLLSIIWLLVIKTIWGFFLFGILLGVAYGGLSAQLSPLTAKFFWSKITGNYLWTGCCWIYTRSAIGPVLTGYIFDSSGSYQLAFLFCGIAVLAGIFCVHSWCRKTKANWPALIS